ncbi:MAG: hypothetical protein AB7F38_12795 [Piscinibacter sp.]
MRAGSTSFSPASWPMRHADGVDAERLLPGAPDMRLVRQAGRSNDTWLPVDGVRIHELERAVLHAKTAQVNGIWSTVASSHPDVHSLAGHHELKVVMLQALFEQDRRHARPIALERWR